MLPQEFGARGSGENRRAASAAGLSASRGTRLIAKEAGNKKASLGISRRCFLLAFYLCSGRRDASASMVSGSVAQETTKRATMPSPWGSQTSYCAEDLLQLHCHVDGMAADLEIEVIREERVELDAQQAAFREERAVQFDVGEEMGRRAFREDHRFAAEGAHFCAADIEDVGQGGDIGERHVGGGAHEAVAEARAVDVEGQGVFVADAAQRRELVFRVERSVFRGVGNVDHA